ncbi:MAG: DUF1926 domain-containing protein [Treponema sp.]|nr:DUF1926 domain-containing protein [Treponema sp.]
MKQNIKVILGSHHHIPYGACDNDFANAYDLKLKPFITALYKFPRIPVVLHYSGVLLYWIERHHPEFFMLIEEMISRKQIEFLGGGFYEPLFPLIPLSDKIGQIEMLTTYLRKQFGKRPQGCWLPCLSWDQSLVGALSTSGMNFTFLDENQFRLAGIEKIDYPCVTEDLGKLITVFPIASRYHADFAEKKAGKVLDAIISENEESSDRIISIFPEQFCKDTSNAASVELALHDFFQDVSQTSNSFTFTSPSRLLKSALPLRKAYFPTSSEPRFMYWAMDANSRRKFQAPEDAAPQSTTFYPGAMAKQFLVQYPEANGIYSKMMYISMLISQLRGDKSRKLTAREELWKAQGCDSFCHIGEGGIYRNTIRKAVYKSLLEAEKITREKRDFIPSLAVFDFTLDGESEYLFQNKDINAYVKSLGAVIFELDYLPKAWNYLDTFSRRKESYIDTKTIEDTYRRSAFSDRLVPANITFQDAFASNFGNHRLCVLEPYSILDMDRSHQKANFKLSANPDLPFGNIEIEKHYHLKKDSINVSYTITNQGDSETIFQFIPEIDLSFFGESEKFQRILTLGDSEKVPVSMDDGNLNTASGLELQDMKNEVVITLLFDTPSNVWILPIRTLCRINGNITEQYQSTCVMPVKKLALKPQESYKTVFTLKFYH